MLNSTVKFWLILAVAVLLAAASIGLVLKIAKFLVYLILIAILAPVFYVLIRMLLPKSFTDKQHKLKERD